MLKFGQKNDVMSVKTVNFVFFHRFCVNFCPNLSLFKSVHKVLATLRTSWRPIAIENMDLDSLVHFEHSKKGLFLWPSLGWCFYYAFLPKTIWVQ